MERNQHTPQKKSDFRACSKILKFDQEVRKILIFSQNSKIKILLVTVETLENPKKLNKSETLGENWNFVCSGELQAV